MTTVSLLTRKEQEQDELKTLASYATFACNSKGRAFDEEEHAFRTCFQRDRDRVIHCEAFRRLEYKTQVFVYEVSDHYRTRLTHTLEVSQIARTLARMLRVNQDLVEVHALAHDMGHPPFGHAGERELQALMADEGGFEHNAQVLRIVNHLEMRYPAFAGLNLTAETRRCLLKTRPAYAGDDKAMSITLPVEAQLVDIADEISYSSHDLDDGIEAGLLREDDVFEVAVWREAKETVDAMFPGIDEKRKRFQIIIQVINNQVRDVAEETLRRLQSNDGQPENDTVGYSSAMKSKVAEAKRYLFQNLYRHETVMKATERCQYIIPALFEYYENKPEELPPAYQERTGQDGIKRTVCDYIAGMTDRYAERDYERLFGTNRSK